MLFFYFISRSFDLEDFYSDRGLLMLSNLAEVISPYALYSVFTVLKGTFWLWFCHILLLGSLLGMALGVYPRLLAFVAFLLHLSFLHRNPVVAYGVDSVATYFLLYLSFADADPSARGYRRIFNSLFLRLTQVQVCIIYFYSGILKLSGTHWWRGEAVWDVLMNPALARWDFSALGSYPALLAVSNYVILFWEIYFPVLVWSQSLRRPMLLLGGVLHLGIGVALQLPYFAGLMMVSYVLFFTSQEMDWLHHQLKKIIPFSANRPQVLPCSTDEIIV